jgi:hypothetical protein
MSDRKQTGKSLIVALTTFPPRENSYLCVSETGTLEGPYGAPDLVAATFGQRPNWWPKFFEFFFAFFRANFCFSGSLVPIPFWVIDRGTSR